MSDYCAGECSGVMMRRLLGLSGVGWEQPLRLQGQFTVVFWTAVGPESVALETPSGRMWSRIQLYASQPPVSGARGRVAAQPFPTNFLHFLRFHFPHFSNDLPFAFLVNSHFFSVFDFGKFPSCPHNTTKLQNDTASKAVNSLRCHHCQGDWLLCVDDKQQILAKAAEMRMSNKGTLAQRITVIVVDGHDISMGSNCRGAGVGNFVVCQFCMGNWRFNVTTKISTQFLVVPTKILLVILGLFWVCLNSPR